MYPSRRRPAFRLVELLVATAIVAVAGGLPLSALPGTRLALSRTQCANNLKQIILAAHNHADTHQLDLPALACDRADAGYGDYNGCIFVTLLPYLEAIQLFKRDAMAMPSCTWYAPDPSSGRRLCARPLRTFQCPLDVTLVDGYAENQKPDGAVSQPSAIPWAGTS